MIEKSLINYLNTYIKSFNYKLITKKFLKTLKTVKYKNIFNKNAILNILNSFF